MKIEVGERFGRLAAIEPAGQNSSRNYVWKCQCDCGKTAVVSASSLVGGRTRSCGCLRDEVRVAQGHANRTHGKRHSRVYKIWLKVKDRCQNPKHVFFNMYGGRGISVCDRWLVFANFFADMGDVPDGCSIERIDNDRGYEPGNCRWATSTEQSRNKRNNVFITHGGKTLCVSDWATELGIPRPTIAGRMRAGWPIEQVLRTSQEGRNA